MQLILCQLDVAVKFFFFTNGQFTNTDAADKSVIHHFS